MGTWRTISITGSNPYSGGAKHVYLAWHPVKKRLYTYSGDFTGANSAFGNPNPGQSFTTNNPSSPQTYDAIDSLRSDMYSIDPYGSTHVWRGEHPFKVLNIGGQRERRAPGMCQASVCWDPVRSKFWCFVNVLRWYDFEAYMVGGIPDLWAYGDGTTTRVGTNDYEVIGTHSWVPSADGWEAGAAQNPGTFTLETDQAVIFRRYEYNGNDWSGGRLYTGAGMQRLPHWSYSTTYDRFFCAGGYDFAEPLTVFMFDPSAKTYSYRTVSTTGFTYLIPDGGYTACVGDYFYCVAPFRTTGGTWTGRIFRVNIPAVLASDDGDNLSASYFQSYTLPWAHDETDGTDNAEHTGMVALGTTLYLFWSDFGIESGGVFRACTFDTTTETVGTVDSRANFVARSWVALPDTNEILMMYETNGPCSTAYIYAPGDVPPVGTITLSVR